jgi:hypothetical protein
MLYRSVSEKLEVARYTRIVKTPIAHGGKRRSVTWELEGLQSQRMLNNLTQPLAGLVVGMFSGRGRMSLVIVLISLSMGVIGTVITAVGVWYARRKDEMQTAGLADQSSDGIK